MRPSPDQIEEARQGRYADCDSPIESVRHTSILKRFDLPFHGRHAWKPEFSDAFCRQRQIMVTVVNAASAKVVVFRPSRVIECG
jgi:hypothetical protein